MIQDSRVKELVVSLFQQESSRDKQKKVGASDFSDPCEYHLAKKLLGQPNGEFKYFLGAKIGTAVHEFLETRIPLSNMDAFPEFSNTRIEESIILGELPNYGVIKSKPDLMFVDQKHLIDWKTTKRDKAKQMQAVIYGLAKDTKVAAEANYTLKKYYAQTQIYAYGLNLNEKPIDGCSLVFINRDGTGESDIWTWTFKYDEAFAKSMWARLERIWTELESGKNLEEFPKDEFCFNCKVLESNEDK